MLNWSINQIELKLKYTWKISRNASDFKINSIITCNDLVNEGKGEAAPNIRYNETPELLLLSFNDFLNAGANSIKNADDLSNILKIINAPNALRFGIEQAYINYLCNKYFYDIMDKEE